MPTIQKTLPVMVAAVAILAMVLTTQAQDTARVQVNSNFGQPANFGLSQFGQSKTQKIQNRISQATQLVSNAKTDDERETAEEQLKEALGEDYDARLDDYESHLDQMEKQLAEMRAKLKRRRAAKTEMIQLRMQVVAAEADELGWPSRASRFPSTFYNNSTAPRFPTLQRPVNNTSQRSQSSTFAPSTSTGK